MRLVMMDKSGLRARASVGIVIVMLLLTSACAAVPGTRETWDPWEGFNRGVFGFNDAVDKAVLKPVSEGYLKVVPAPVRTTVSNFFDNLSYVNVILNGFLQGKGAQGVSDTGRFLINSTLGLVGLIDIATSAGIPRHEEDFGQTLAVWGVAEGAYLVLPLLGPSTFRDAPGLAFAAASNPLAYVSADTAVIASISALGAVDLRARAKGVFELIEVAAVDRYIFVREAYRQRRLSLIYDGNPPLAPLELEKAPPAPAERGKPLQ